MYKRFVLIRSNVLVYLTHQLALPFLKLIRKPERFPYSKEQLRQFPQGSLGKDLIDMLEQNNLQLLTHYAKHDMKHILLGYPTTAEGEICLQAFMFGSGHLSFPVFITIVFGMLTMPEYWSSIINAYKRRKNALSIADWDWSVVVHTNTRDLQERILNP
jgi:ubiquinone biosynthesis protein Coq4